jgi:hypothetical protein
VGGTCHAACMPASIIIHQSTPRGSCTGADGRVGHAARTESCPRPCTATAGPVPTKIIARVRGPGHSPVTVTGPPLIFLFFLREEMIIKTNKGGTSPWLWRGKPSTLRLRGLRLLCVLVRATGAAVCFSLACRRTGGAGYAASSFDRRADHRLGADGSITHPRTAWQGDFLRVIRPCSLACSNRRRLVRKQRIGSLAHLSFPHKLS